MRYIISILIISWLTGCSLLPATPDQPLEKLSNDELCQSLGTYNENGSLILKIHSEINKRGATINTERCFALETAAKEKSNFSYSSINKEINKNIYSLEPWLNNPHKIRVIPHSEVLNPDPGR